MHCLLLQLTSCRPVHFSPKPFLRNFDTVWSHELQQVVGDRRHSQAFFEFLKWLGMLLCDFQLGDRRCPCD